MITLSREQQIAMRDAHESTACDEYFKARHEMLDTIQNRRTFEAGFKRGWDALAQQAEPAVPVAWIRFRSDGAYDGPIMDAAMEDVRKRSGAWTPLCAPPTPPAEPSPAPDAATPAPVEAVAEADRRAGAAERALATCQETLSALTRTRDKMKEQWGAHRNVSFDVVWQEALALKQAAAPSTAPQEAPERKPLTAAQMEAGREAIFSTGNPYCPCDSKTFRKVAEWTERHHGIGESATLAKVKPS